MTDIFQVFEKVQMIFFYIEDNADSGVKIQKAVCIFTGFRNKGFGITYTYVAADGLQNAANRYSWVQISFQENMGNHGGGCGLPMCSGNGNGILIVFHQLSKQFCPCKHRVSYVQRLQSAPDYHG